MTPYPNIYGVIPSPAMVMVLTGRGMVLEICTHGIPVVNPSQKMPKEVAGSPCIMLASNLLDIIDDIVYSNCCILINRINSMGWRVTWLVTWMIS